jgi:hypothetical protein
VSVRILSRVLEDASITNHSDLLVAIVIADFAHDDGSGAYPSVETIARKSRQSERNVHYCLARLEAQGKLAICKGGGPKGVNLYRLTVGWGAMVAPCQPDRGAMVAPGGVQTATGGGANGDIKGCKAFAPNPSVPVIEPLVQIELPHNFPKTEKEAITQSMGIGCDEAFVRSVWYSAHSAGGLDGMQRRITCFRSYVGKLWPKEQAKRHQERTRRSDGRPDLSRTQL